MVISAFRLDPTTGVASYHHFRVASRVWRRVYVVQRVEVGC